VAFLAQQQADGFLAYSEGLCDDINKVLVAGLGAGNYETSDELLRAYAARYLGGDEAAWSAWLSRMGRVDTVDPVEARSRFDEITTSSRPSWRLRALAEKLNMLESDAAVRSETTWNQAKLAAAGNFWAAKERLWREVWGLGLGRHALKFDWQAPDWYAEYVQQGAGLLSTEEE